MNNYRFEIKGLTPLIMNANSIDARDELEARRSRMKGGKRGDDRFPADSWKGNLYTSDKSGNICIPNENLLSCLLGGGTKTKAGTSGKETLKTWSQRVMFHELDYDLLVGGKPISKASINKITGEFAEQANECRALGFKLYVKSATIGKAKHTRVRPLFGNWSIIGMFEIDDEDTVVLNLTRLNELFSTCGRQIGLGDWRPSSPTKPGQYGRFSATVDRV